jgi:hypothetical protein
MKKFAMFAVAAATVVAGLWAEPSYGADRGAKGMEGKAAATKPELYTVVQVGDEISAIKKSELNNLKKTTADEDKKRKKDYDEAKKAAVKSKDKSDLGKPPAKRVVKVLKSSLKSEEEATRWIEDHPAGSKDSGTKTAKTKKSSAW